MSDQVETNLLGAEVNRSGKGIIDHRNQIVVSGKSCDASQVAYFHQGIGDRLDVDHTGLRTKRGGPGIRRTQVDRAVGDAEPRRVMIEEALGASVEGLLGEKVLAVTDESQQNVRNRSHTAGCHQRLLSGLDHR
jgi:hypothetical protein